jgi:hypothetical protein
MLSTYRDVASRWSLFDEFRFVLVGTRAEFVFLVLKGGDQVDYCCTCQRGGNP